MANGENSIVSAKAKPEHVANFFSELFGDKKSISRYYDYTFRIDINWLLDLFDLIDARVQRQHEASIILSQIDLFFENGKDIRLNTIDQFKEFNDTSTDISAGCSINLKYMINFPTRKSPEIQEISFVATTINHNEIDKTESKIRRLSIFSNDSDSFIKLTISHTDITWAEDILSIVNKKIDSSFTKNNSLLSSLRTILLTLTPMIAMIILTYFTFGEIIKQENQNVIELIENRDTFFHESGDQIQDMNRKLDIFYDFFSERKRINRNRIVFGFAIALSMVFIVPIVLKFLKNKSFVIFNEITRKRQRKYDSIRTGIVYTLLTVIILGGAMNIASPSIRDFLFG